MLKPAVEDVLKHNESRYSLVIAVAKRAREITEEAESSGEIILDKPVSLAVNEIAQGKYQIVESEELKELEQPEQKN